ncbi:MAG: cutinase family protein [Mycobacterium sp.]|nr:cutinase family protein [Mycobacterium sp.]
MHRGAVGAMVCTAAAIAMAPASAAAAPAAPTCPDLFVLGVQGTSESNPAADPLATTGMIGQVFGPLANNRNIGHTTIPYVAAFGGAPGTGLDSTPFATSQAQAEQHLDATATSKSAQCPSTSLAFVGFSQGGGVVADYARKIGAGATSIRPDRVAGVAAISDWTRAPGGDRIPGRPGQTTPDPPAGTTGVATSHVHLPPVPTSGGIGANTTGFGSLTGHVAEICAAGDLSCDAPPHAELLRAAGGIAAQADLHDPVAAAATLSAGASRALVSAKASLALNDLHVEGGQVNYVPAEPASQRLADAADPRHAQPTPDQQRAADGRIAQAVAAVAADPVRQLPRLGGQIGAAIGANLAANADLTNPATLAKYGNVVASHTGYGARGDTQKVSEWVGAMAHDIERAKR